MAAPDQDTLARPLARRERHQLCDLALQVGPDAPTLCDGWTVFDLIAHLVVRERRPLAAGGIVLVKMSSLTEKSMARVCRRPFAEVVASIRDPKPPFSLNAVERAANTVEWFVHHEDILRAVPGWTVRPMDAADEADLFARLTPIARMLAGEAGVPVTMATPSGLVAPLVRGKKPVTITGRASELALFLHGRSQVEGLEFDGPGRSVAQLRATTLGM